MSADSGQVEEFSSESRVHLVTGVAQPSMKNPQLEVKKKKPPTFQHLPLNRAKKLKKSWVEVQKIRSQWKAQKKREGLITRLPQAERHDSKASDGNEEMSEGPSDGEGDHEMDQLESGSSGGEEIEEQRSPKGKDHSRTLRGEARSERRGQKTTSLPSGREGTTPLGKPVDGVKEGPSLRELHNQAYSRSSLHHYKSRTGRRTTNGNPHNRGRDSNDQQQRRGRGQPNMRLRMTAMLEKIKKDLT